MHSYIGRTESAEDALIVEIATLARRYVVRIVGRDAAEDIAQDVALECLLNLRAGKWNAAPDTIGGFVRRVVKRRAINYLQKSQRRARETAYGRMVQQCPRSWMSPELAIEEQELTELREQTLIGLSKACRQAYLIVWEERATYEAVAKRLRIRRTTVSAHVVKAQDRFRESLAEQGIVAIRRPKGRQVTATQYPTTGRKRRGRAADGA